MYSSRINQLHTVTLCWGTVVVERAVKCELHDGSGEGGDRDLPLGVSRAASEFPLGRCANLGCAELRCAARRWQSPGRRSSQRRQNSCLCAGERQWPGAHSAHTDAHARVVELVRI